MEHTMDYEPTPDYYWIVTCKNRRFHKRENVNYEHHIPLGETDCYSSLPKLPDQITVRCNSCGKVFRYLRQEVLRAEVREAPVGFQPHQLFSTAA